MSKTIEEAANEYADNAYYPATDYGWYESDDEQMKECLSETFKAGTNYVYGLPLASRLTAEDKERVRHLYKCAMEIAQFYQQEAMFRINLKRRIGYEASRDIAKGEVSILEILFGKDFFKEEE